MTACSFKKVGAASYRTGTAVRSATITQFKRGLWQVAPRGWEPYLLRSKAAAKRAACAYVHKTRFAGYSKSNRKSRRVRRASKRS